MDFVLGSLFCLNGEIIEFLPYCNQRERVELGGVWEEVIEWETETVRERAQ